MTKIYRKSKGQWAKIIAAQERSGRSAKAYCEAQGIGLAAFYKWRKRFKDGTPPLEISQGEQFIELKQNASAVSSSASVSWHIELNLGDGIGLTLRRG